MAEPFLGEIRIFAGNFAPRGFALCDGQLLAIAQNDALFALLGTTYGGDGRTTFALPDLRGRLPIGGPSAGPGLTERRQGARGGSETETLQIAQIPSHTHELAAVNAPAANPEPTGGQFAEPESDAYADGGGRAAGATTSIGGGQAHDNQPPQLVLNYIIATVGIFPARN